MLSDLMSFLGALGKKIQSIFYWFTDKLHDVLVGAWNFIVDACCYLVEMFIRAIDFKVDIFNATWSFAHLPDQLIYLLNQCGVNNMIMCIVTAVIIRVTLNIIPGALTRI